MMNTIKSQFKERVSSHERLVTPVICNYHGSLRNHLHEVIAGLHTAMANDTRVCVLWIFLHRIHIRSENY